MNARSHRETDDQPLADHSGTRLVLWTCALPAAFFAGWVAIGVTRHLAQPLGDAVLVSRLSYAVGAVAFVIALAWFVRMATSFAEPTPLDDGIPDDFPREDIGTWDSDDDDRD